MEQRAAHCASERQVNASKFALAAFVDENGDDHKPPLARRMERFPLQLDLRRTTAGVKFFERLDELLKQIES